MSNLIKYFSDVQYLDVPIDFDESDIKDFGKLTQLEYIDEFSVQNEDYRRQIRKILPKCSFKDI